MAGLTDPLTGDPVARAVMYVEDSGGLAVRVSAGAPLPAALSTALPAGTNTIGSVLTAPAAPVVLLNQASAPVTVTGMSATLSTVNVSTLAVDVNVTAVTGTTPTLNVYVDRQGADSVWYVAWAGAQMTAAGVSSTSLGAGAQTALTLTSACRLRWVVGGVSPSFTFSASIVGR